MCNATLYSTQQLADRADQVTETLLRPPPCGRLSEHRLKDKRRGAEINKMATNTPQSEADCTCPVCCDIFTDPVLLLCGHSFCQHCLQEWWRQSTQRTCPVCKEIFHMTQPPRNLALRNLSDSLRQEKSKRPGSKEICSLHGEKFKLFCQDDQQPICLICRDAKAHNKHNCIPISEAAEEYRAKVQINLLNLKSKRGSFKSQKQDWDKTAAHIQVQAQQTERTIRAEFQKLYQFLREEEAGRIDACRKEAKLKSDAMNVRIVNLTTEISDLRKKIKIIEEEMRADDLSFMLNVKTTLERSLCKLSQPKTLTGTLIDEAKHVGNLQLSVFRKMADIVQYTPVFLDPNTGSYNLIVSENLTRSSESQKFQSFPYNPERMSWSNILGYQGFNSGIHSWDVEVDGYWAVGVTDKTNLQIYPYLRTWAMHMCTCTNILRNLTLGDYMTEIAKDSFPQKVRVELDYNRGILSFFDIDRRKTVHTIKYRFTETVFPYFRSNAKILPSKPLVRITHPKSPVF
ncbi:E3 ubiquitin-protein ligase TRIM35-like [Anableps anableps]